MFSHFADWEKTTRNVHTDQESDTIQGIISLKVFLNLPKKIKKKHANQIWYGSFLSKASGGAQGCVRFVEFECLAEPWLK